MNEAGNTGNIEPDTRHFSFQNHKHKDESPNKSVSPENN